MKMFFVFEGGRSQCFSSTSTVRLPAATSLLDLPLGPKRTLLQAFLDYLLKVLGLGIPPPSMTDVKAEESSPLACCSRKGLLFCSFASLSFIMHPCLFSRAATLARPCCAFPISNSPSDHQPRVIFADFDLHVSKPHYHQCMPSMPRHYSEGARSIGLSAHCGPHSGRPTAMNPLVFNKDEVRYALYSHCYT